MAWLIRTHYITGSGPAVISQTRMVRSFNCEHHRVVCIDPRSVLVVRRLGRRHSCAGRGANASFCLNWLGTIPTQFRRYVEPFAGSACLFFALRPAAAVLGDINLELLDAYSAIRSHPRRVARLALSWEDSKRILAISRSPATLANSIERAVRFVYLNRYCFNGVYRTNRLGMSDVPRGVRTGEFPTEKNGVPLLGRIA